MLKNTLILMLTISTWLSIYNSYNRGKMIDELLLTNRDQIEQQKLLQDAVEPYIALKPILTSRDATVVITNDGVNFVTMRFQFGQQIQ